MKIYVFALAVLTTIRSASLLGLFSAYSGLGGPSAVGGNAHAVKVAHNHGILRRSSGGHDRAGDELRTIKIIHQQTGSQAGYRASASQGSYGGGVQIIRIVHVQDNGLSNIGGSDSYGGQIGNGDTAKTIKVIHQPDGAHGSYDTANLRGSSYRQGLGGQRDSGDAVKTIRVVHKHAQDHSNFGNNGGFHALESHGTGHNSVKKIKVIHQHDSHANGQEVPEGVVKSIKVMHQLDSHGAENLGGNIDYQGLSGHRVPDRVVSNIKIIHQHESHGDGNLGGSSSYQGLPGPSVSDGPVKSINVLHQHEIQGAENPGANINYQGQSEQSLSDSVVQNINADNLVGNIGFQGSSDQGVSGGSVNTIQIVHQQADTSDAYGDNGAYDDNSVSADYGDNIKSIEVLPQASGADPSADYSSDSVSASGGVLYDSYGNAINGNSDEGYANGNSYIENSNYANTYFNDNNASTDINVNANTNSGFSASIGNNAASYSNDVYSNQPATAYLPQITRL